MAPFIRLTRHIPTSHYDCYYEYRAVDVSMEEIAAVTGCRAVSGANSTIVLKSGVRFNCRETHSEIAAKIAEVTSIHSVTEKTLQPNEEVRV